MNIGLLVVTPRPWVCRWKLCHHVLIHPSYRVSAFAWILHQVVNRLVELLLSDLLLFQHPRLLALLGMSSSLIVVHLSDEIAAVLTFLVVFPYTGVELHMLHLIGLFEYSLPLLIAFFFRRSLKGSCTHTSVVSEYNSE